MFYLCFFCLTADKINYRLPKNLKPSSYHLTLQPYLGSNPAWQPEKDFSFDGEMVIKYTCEEPTDRIVFHSVDLDIDEQKLELTSALDQNIKIIKGVEFDDLREFAILTTDRQCVKGAEYELKIVFHGSMSDRLSGFYQTSYQDENGDTQ